MDKAIPAAGSVDHCGMDAINRHQLGRVIFLTAEKQVCCYIEKNAGIVMPFALCLFTSCSD